MSKRPWTKVGSGRERRTRLAAVITMAMAAALALAALGVPAAKVRAQPPQARPQPSKESRPAANDAQPPKEKAKLGVQVNKPNAFSGYTLVFPLQSTKTYLIDMQGRVVRTWQSKYLAGQEAYLLENGHLLRPAKVTDSEAIFAGAGAGGRVQEFTWEGELIWDFKFHNEKQTQHHAVTRMPNGNVMLIVWERKTAKEAVAAGVKPELAGSAEMLVDSLIEVKPEGKTGGQIVWEWHLWDHLIQDRDSARANHGDVAAHPELVDVNFGRSTLPAFANLAQGLNPQPKRDDSKKGGSKNDALDKLKGIGYVGAGGGRRFAGFMPDWTHVNAVAYNARLDQVMLCPREFNEVWIIDHSTTTAEAAGHAGGRYGKGGDLLYRWGNPRAYRAGTAADQRLFSQHDAHWIPEGLPGEGHLLVFSNGGGRERNYSSVDEVVLPVSPDGRYEHKPGTAFGPDKPVWSYTAPNKGDFFAVFMSGAQRLPNGNTLICTGFSGTIFEVTPEKEIVWNYINPAKAAPGTGGFGMPGGRPGMGGPGRFQGSTRSVQLLPGFLQFALQLSPEQRKRLDAFETEASRKLEELLTDAQRKQLKETQRNAGPFGPGGGPPEFGRVMARSVQDRLELTADQRKEVEGLQKDAAAKVDEILKDEQKKQLKEIQDRMKAFAGGMPGFGPGGPGGRGRPGGPAGFGGMGGSGIFRAYRYGTDYPGLAGKDLTPSKTIEELEAKPAEKKN
jgi:Arylsulfotransferase (ASST)